MPDRSAPRPGAAGQAVTGVDPRRYTPVSVLAGAEPWLEMRNITKVYPNGTRALENVDLVVAKGEIHGLLGENGAGKSTLMKILSGILPLTAGRVLLGGQEVSLRNTNDALARGIGMVHQHFSLVPT